MPRKIHDSTSIHSGIGSEQPMGEAPEERPGAMTDPARATDDTADQVAEASKDFNYYEDFGREAGERGRQPLGERGDESDDPNAATMADHDREGEGYRQRGRNAFNTTEPMTDMVEDAPDGHAGDQGSAGTGGPRSQDSDDIH